MGCLLWEAQNDSTVHVCQYHWPHTISQVWVLISETFLLETAWALLQGLCASLDFPIRVIAIHLKASWVLRVCSLCQLDRICFCFRYEFQCMWTIGKLSYCILKTYFNHVITRDGSVFVVSLTLSHHEFSCWPGSKRLRQCSYHISVCNTLLIHWKQSTHISNTIYLRHNTRIKSIQLINLAS